MKAIMKGKKGRGKAAKTSENRGNGSVKLYESWQKAIRKEKKIRRDIKERL